MINPQLLNYVRVQRQAGVPKEEIIKALAGGGWSAQDAQEAFAAIEGVQVPPQPPKPIPPPITAAPTPAPQPVMRPVQPAAPMQQPAQPAMQAMPAQPMAQTSVRIQPQAVVQRQPAYAQVKKRRVWPWMLLLIIFLLGGFVGGAYATVQYPLVEDMVRSIQSLISPAKLEPVYDPNPVQEQQENNLPSFMPQIDPLGTSTSTTATTTTTSGAASTTPR